MTAWIKAYPYFFSDAEEEVETIDPYDLLDPVDILSQLPKVFYEQIVSNRYY